MQKNPATRRIDLDFLRITAIIAVVIIHCIAFVVTQRPINSEAWIAANVIDSFMRWCVPVFVMISGALLIKKTSFTNMQEFFKKRASRILIPLVAWPIIYAVWSTFFMNHEITISKFLTSFLGGYPAVGFQLYFLFLIAGLYALTPIISLYATHTTRRQLWITTLIILGATCVWYNLQAFLPEGGVSHNMFTQGLPYVGYFMLGYLFKDVNLQSYRLPIVVFIIGSLLMALAYYLAHLTGFSAPIYSNQSIFVTITAPAAFFTGQFIYKKLALYFTRKPRLNFDSVLQHLSATAFGVFLIHIIVMRSTIAIFQLDKTSLKIGLVLIPITLFFSWLAVVGLSKIPKVKLLFG